MINDYILITMPNIDHVKQKALEEHKKLQGKIEVKSKGEVKSYDDLSIYYTPGVGAVSSYLAQNKSETPLYTIKGNTIAVVSDGSAVLGLGNIGPEGALPVMEGKAMLFKEFAGINAFPIVLDTQDTEEIIQTVKNIAPVFGGINLEDISAPRCFEIEDRLKEMLNIPVMHDDQHGTAVVVLAGVINALKVVNKNIGDIKIVVVGAGAAGTAVAKLLLLYGAKNVLVLDSKGIISKNRADLDSAKQKLADITNPDNIRGNLEQAMENADIVIGVSGPGIIKGEYVKKMSKDAIVFALANPVPEIMPDEAKANGALIVATGRSDFPNQVNNSLGFPGIFKGALENKVNKITDDMKVKAAVALASLVQNPTPEKIIPGIFDDGVVEAVSSAIK